MINTKLVNRAIEFAIEKHKGQTRRDSGIPYVTHPAEVAWLVTTFKKSKHITSLIICAILHDVVEDCDVTIEEIESEFGSFVASIVSELTSDPLLIKKYGKNSYLIQKMLTMSNYALVIKLVDRLHNVNDNSGYHHRKAEKYWEDTELMICTLEKFRKLTKTQQDIVNCIKLDVMN